MGTCARATSALGDPTRRVVLELLGDLAKGLPVSRPDVSQHLRVLKRAGLVGDRGEGKRRVYSVVPESVAEVRAHFDLLWAHALANGSTVTEREV